MSLRIKTEIKKAIPGIIGSALVAFFGNDSKKWLYAIVCFIVIYCVLTIAQYRIEIVHQIKKAIYTLMQKPFIKSVRGFCGRDDVIEKIYKQYYETNKIGTVLICGLGGSGKTTIMVNFRNALVNSPKLVPFSKGLSPEAVPNKCIVYADYAYENLEDLRNLITALRNNKKKKRILFVLLERTYAKDYVSIIKFDLIIDLNEPKYTLKKEDLVAIIDYNVSNAYDYEKGKYTETKLTIPTEKSEQFADQIIDIIDKSYNRPIFAVIIAELYRNNQELNLNETVSMNQLLEKYWNIKTRYHMIQGLINATESDFYADKDRILEAINSAKQLVQVLTLFGAMSKLTIEYHISDVIIQTSSGRITDESLAKQIKSYFNRMLDNDIKKHLVIAILGIDISNTSSDARYTHFVLKPIQYDIVSSWLLTKFLSQQPDYLKELQSIVISVTNKDIDKTILSFILRTLDEGNTLILEWYRTLKDCFTGYNPGDFLDTIYELLSKFCWAKNNGKAKTQETINTFLIGFIDTIREHINNDKEIEMLVNYLEIQKNRSEFSDAKEIIDTLIEKIEKDNKENKLS